MKSKRFWLLGLVIACSLVIQGGCGSDGKSVSPDMAERQQQEEQSEKEDQEKTEEKGEEKQEADLLKLGDFSLQDIYGAPYTQDMFGEYQLTLVNIFATWCSPCVKEIPDLEKLKNDMADQEVNVVGIVLDAIDSSGNTDQEAVEKAKLLAEKTGATYTFLVPDEGYLNGLLLGVEAVPTTFFVDQEGNVVGEAYVGARSLEEWTGIVETLLKGDGQ